MRSSMLIVFYHGLVDKSVMFFLEYWRFSVTLSISYLSSQGVLLHEKIERKV